MANFWRFLRLYFSSTFHTCVLNSHQGHSMCGSMVDIQCATAEEKRRRKKKKNNKKPQDENIMSASATQSGRNKRSFGFKSLYECTRRKTRSSVCAGMYLMTVITRQPIAHRICPRMLYFPEFCSSSSCAFVTMLLEMSMDGKAEAASLSGEGHCAARSKVTVDDQRHSPVLPWPTPVYTGSCMPRFSKSTAIEHVEF